jgi:predicted O-methyltransferase YrrM
LAFLNAVPELKATLFDTPEVIEMARQRLGKEGVLDRVDLVGGDYNRDALPAGHDLAFLSAIIHQNTAEQNVSLYRKVWDALLPGGRIVIRDHIMSPDRTRPRSGAVFAVNMLVAGTGGNSYTYDEIETSLREAGFSAVRLLHEDAKMAGLVEGVKP